MKNKTKKQIGHIGILISTQLGMQKQFLDVARAFPKGIDIPVDDVEIDDQISEFKTRPDTTNGAVLLPMMQGRGLTPHLYCTIGHIFRTRGYDPVIIVCENDMDHCLVKQYHKDDWTTCEMCHYSAKTYLDEFGYEYHSPNEFLPDDYAPNGIEDWNKDTVYHGVEVGNLALASTRRHFKRHRLDTTTGPEEAVFERYLRTAKFAVDLSNCIFDSKDISAVVAHDASYPHGGAFIAAADHHSIPGISFGKGYDSGHLLFGNVSNRAPNPQFESVEAVKAILNRPLDKKTHRNAQKVMDRRSTGTGVRADYTGGKHLNVSGEKCTAGLFTNLMWDGSLEAGNVVFDDPFEWLERTIEFIGEDSRKELIIKPHPAESLRGTNQGVSSYITDRYDTLPEGVQLLDLEMNIDPYKMIKSVDVGIVYTSTIGLEMAYHGLPVITAGLPHYRGFGITTDPDNRKEYFQKLANMENIKCSNDMRKRAIKYVDFLFNMKQVKFPFYSEDGADVKFKNVDHHEIVENDAYDRIVKHAIEGKPMFIEM